MRNIKYWGLVCLTIFILAYNDRLISSWSYVPWYLTRTLIDGATCLLPDSPTRKMDTPTRKRKREIQEEENDEFSFVFGTCGLHLKRRKKTSKSALPFPKNGKQLPQLPARFDHPDAQVCFGLICLLYVKLMSRRLFTLQKVIHVFNCVKLNATF